MEGNISPKFASAIVKAQANVEGAKKGRSNPAFRSKYADLAAVWDAVSDALTEQGLAVLQFPTEAPAGFVGLDTMLVHSETGEVLTRRFTMPVKDASNPQAVGSALTYARRYALSAVLGVCPEDDDGNVAASVNKQQQAPVHVAGPTLAEAEKQFADCRTPDGMKAVFTAVRNGNAIPEPAKTALLKKFSDAIKEAQKKDS